MSMKNVVLLGLAAFVVVVIVPGTFVAGQFLAGPIQSAGIDINANYRGGTLIASFSDPEGDLLRELPSELDSVENARALDLLDFSVRKVTMSALAGIGIESRLNLALTFTGGTADPAGSDNRFSLPAIHVYIKVPGQQSPASTSDKAVDAEFERASEEPGNPWDYEVIVDGFHAQARIFDTGGRQVGKGLNIFVREVGGADVSSGGTVKVSAHTEITASLPLGITGDPGRGRWVYFVAVGLADVKFSSMMYPAERDGEPALFDLVAPAAHASGLRIIGGKPVLYPLVVENGK
jgi:hypothetical protein